MANVLHRPQHNRPALRRYNPAAPHPVLGGAAALSPEDSGRTSEDRSGLASLPEQDPLPAEELTSSGQPNSAPLPETASLQQEALAEPATASSDPTPAKPPHGQSQEQELPQKLEALHVQAPAPASRPTSAGLQGASPFASAASPFQSAEPFGSESSDSSTETESEAALTA